MSWLKGTLFLKLPASIAGNNQVTAKRVNVLTFAKLLISISCRTLSVLLTFGPLLRKLFLSVAICAMLGSCFPAKDLQGDLVYATLVKVEELNRYPDVKTKVLTWKTTKSVSFTTFESASVDIPIGTKTRVVVVR